MKKLLYCTMRAICLCSLICVLPLFSVTIRVPSQYPTIQQGLNAAQFGDTVLVAAGTYDENITWPSRDGIILISEDGPQTTTIDGGGLNRVISFPNFAFTRNTEINSFTIQNGATDYGAGLYLYGSPHIIGNYILRNISRDTTTRHYGGGIYCSDNASPLIEKNLIRGNVVEGPNWNYGGGIYLDYQNTAVILGNIIEDDSAIGGSWNYGAGIYCSRETSADIRHNIIYANIAYQGSRGYGVGIYSASDATNYILSNLIYGNVAQCDLWNYGAGIRLENGASVLNNTLVDNRCVGGTWRYGGGIYINDSTSTIGNNIIVGNNASNGGGISAGTNGYATLLNNDVWNNIGGNYYQINPGANDISLDPLFVTGPLGDYYLSQTAAGQPQNSPCIDYGFATAESLELHTFTTRTDTIYDEGIVDLGYHYPTQLWVSMDEYWNMSANGFFYTHLQVNPTLSRTGFKISLSISQNIDIKLDVFDHVGRLIKQLHSGSINNGYAEWIWAGQDDHGYTVPSGVYFILAKAGSAKVLSRKVILME